jgi:hypothetical protein
MDELLRKIGKLEALLEAAMTRIAELEAKGKQDSGNSSKPPSLWTFLHRASTVPTSNAAERSIRKAVLWRKVSLGADSEGGCRFVERMLTVAGTARKRGVDLLDWLTRAIQAELNGIPPPALV